MGFYTQGIDDGDGKILKVCYIDESSLQMAFHMQIKFLLSFRKIDLSNENRMDESMCKMKLIFEFTFLLVDNVQKNLRKGVNYLKFVGNIF